MITLLGSATWHNGHVDGAIRDIRRPLPEDGLLSGAVLRMGDPDAGPVVAMSIEGRIFPRKAPVHLHKSDSFRMALGEPIRVGGTSYAHGEFRLQRADAFYGPEYWTDEVGTNQLLLMADRRGLKPYLTDAQLQRLADTALADDVSLEGVAMLPRDADVPHAIANSFGAVLRPSHFDAGFTDTTRWSTLGDGSRLAAVALGHRESGVLLLCWDRPAGAAALPAFRLGTDLVRLVVEGSCHIDDPGAGGVELGRLGFRLQQEGTWHGASRSGPAGSKELWIVADRRAWPPLTAAGPAEGPLAEAGAEVAALTSRLASAA
ncbi:MULTISPECIES: hypothetical protein [Frankia]|uniref:Uncharacterized protein n=1 Tax=Frankia alni (strain DSM 45986 / CECT 9034 / ACN14a) TaxID=326424 RepID=Q0RL75_FRAAA|nr:MULTISPECIES: hypothetical protein [Frankia]CAJ61730.1 hypothetical protein FRAAL3086 [Frankia alni ACN14a]